MKIENTSIQEIQSIVKAQRILFRKGDTLDLNFRLLMLRALKGAIKKWEARIAEALWQDLHKSYEEAYMTELSIVLGEIDNHIKHLKRWAAPKHI